VPALSDDLNFLHRKRNGAGLRQRHDSYTYNRGVSPASRFSWWHALNDVLAGLVNESFPAILTIYSNGPESLRIADDFAFELVPHRVSQIRR
jgi:hypothetical protein